MIKKMNARNRYIVKSQFQESSGAMQEEQAPREALLLEIETLRAEVEDLKREKAYLENRLETTAARADLAIAHLHQAQKKLSSELLSCQHSETALIASNAELQALVTKISREKADLEILLETTTEHGDLMEELLHAQSIRDPLTGLFNRRYMDKALERELSRARRIGHPLSIVMSDIDHFQRFNNTYGHEAGDIVLRHVGIFLQSNLRKTDIPCRYGGEEFMLILPATSLLESVAKAEQLRAGIKQLKLVHDHQPLGAITLSLGVACFPDRGQTCAEILASADAALYRAKAQGRDRVLAAFP